jgi:hypothetical protein
MIDQDYLVSRLDYDPLSGAFTTNGRSVGSIFTGDNRRTKYIRISIDGRQYRAHRLAWLYIYGRWPKEEIDHIDGNGLNNKLSNLRECTRQENAKNKPLQKNNSSGISGVNWHSASQKWEAQIYVKRKKIYLGLFGCIEDAKRSRKDAEKKYGFHENHGRDNG